MGRVFGGIIVVILVLVAIGLIFIYSGWYNMAASAEHNATTLWIIETTMENSVQHHAGDVIAPDLSDPETVEHGFSHFEAMCVECHGGPGLDADEFAQGLYPQAPDLSAEVNEWSAAELFWIIKHGIKLSGMPSFGETHSDEDIWNIVAFLQRLPDLNESEYLQMRQAHGGEEEGGHQHGEVEPPSDTEGHQH